LLKAQELLADTLDLRAQTDPLEARRPPVKLAVAPSAGLPVERDLTLAYRLSLAIAVLMAVASAAGLLQYGLSAVGFVASTALQVVLTASPLDVATSVALLVFGLVCFVPLALFLRGAKTDAEEPGSPAMQPASDRRER